MTFPSASVGIDTFVAIAPRESAVTCDGVSAEPRTPTTTDSLGVNPPAVSLTDDPAGTLSDDTISLTAKDRTTAALGCVTVGLNVVVVAAVVVVVAAVVVVVAAVVEVVEVLDPAAVGAGATGVPATAFDAGESPFAFTALMVTE